MNKKSVTVCGLLLSTMLAGPAAAAAMLRRRSWRRRPAIPFAELILPSQDGTRLRVRHASAGRDTLVILAHPAVIGQEYAPLTELAELLFPLCDVVTFDFRGHGRSGGRCSTDLLGPLLDLEAVIGYFRRHGYAWIGVAGFSLGGIAGIFNAARRRNMDALVSIGAPPRMPDLSRAWRHPRLSKALLSLAGMRLEIAGPPPATPLDVIARVAPIPLLLVHGNREIFYPRRDFDELCKKAEDPKTCMVLACGHAELGGEAGAIKEWMAARLEERRAAGKELGRG
ncbi:MAG: alpha/beta hydrolase [Candidatus Geothermincolia bacterium]